MSDFYKSGIRSFSDELQALIDYGHDCCARIDDRIYECCQRIREAHEREIGAFELALTWKDAAPLPQYDVLDNERHKVVCELRKSDFTLYTPEQFVSTLYKMLHGTECFPTNIYLMQKGVRDRLIYLLIGDTAEVEDAMDAERCGETNAGDRVPAADKRRADCDDNQLAEEVASITDELREFARRWPCTDYIHKDMLAIADRIDAEHEAACAEAYGNGVQSVALPDMTAYVKLPVDADGEPIHIGDAVTCGATVWTVTGLKFLGDGWGVCCTVYNECGGSGTSVYPPSDLRHYHAPTLEDVLREFALAICKDDALTIRKDVLDEYAAKLMLKED